MSACVAGRMSGSHTPAAVATCSLPTCASRRPACPRRGRRVAVRRPTPGPPAARRASQGLEPRLRGFFFLIIRPPPRSTLFPYTTLFRSRRDAAVDLDVDRAPARHRPQIPDLVDCRGDEGLAAESGIDRHDQDEIHEIDHRSYGAFGCRSEEHTSELQSLRHLVCRLLLDK